MHIRIWLTDAQLNILQDEARLAYRIPKDHLEWLIGQVLASPENRPEALRTRIERLEEVIQRASLACEVT